MDCISPIIYFLTLTATHGQQLKRPENSWKITIHRNEVKKCHLYHKKWCEQMELVVCVPKVTMHPVV